MNEINCFIDLTSEVLSKQHKLIGRVHSVSLPRIEFPFFLRCFYFTSGL